MNALTVDLLVLEFQLEPSYQPSEYALGRVEALNDDAKFHGLLVQEFKNGSQIPRTGFMGRSWKLGMCYVYDTFYMRRTPTANYVVTPLYRK